ncbi:MAG TPA: carboxypeptidase regulatory-like domain-containing protein [Kofleriaceae bacterium]
MRALVVVVVVQILFMPSPALADRADAEKYFRAGAKAYAAQSYAAAAANFDEAYRALPLPEIAFSAAQAYRKLYRTDRQPQHVRRAVELYRIYLKEVKTGGRVGDAGDNLAEMERELERVDARGAATKPAATVERTRIGVTVTLLDREPAKGDPGAVREIIDATSDALPGIAITLDGKPLQPFALVDVSPGDHAITVSGDGYVPVARTQRAVTGATALVEVALVPKPAKLVVKTEDGARIRVDGRPIASTTFELPAGQHLVAVERRGREPFAREISVTRGQELVVRAPLAHTAKRRAVPWLFGGAGVLAGGAIASSILAFVASSNASDLDAQIAAGNAAPAVADALDRELARRDDFRTTALVLGGGAVAASAVGLLFYLFDRPADHRFEVAPTAGGGALTVRGRF